MRSFILLQTLMLAPFPTGVAESVKATSHRLPEQIGTKTARSI